MQFHPLTLSSVFLENHAWLFVCRILCLAEKWWFGLASRCEIAVWSRGVENIANHDLLVKEMDIMVIWSWPPGLGSWPLVMAFEGVIAMYLLVGCHEDAPGGGSPPWGGTWVCWWPCHVNIAHLLYFTLLTFNCSFPLYDLSLFLSKHVENGILLTTQEYWHETAFVSYHQSTIQINPLFPLFPRSKTINQSKNGMNSGPQWQSINENILT